MSFTSTVMLPDYTPTGPNSHITPPSSPTAEAARIAAGPPPLRRSVAAPARSGQQSNGALEEASLVLHGVLMNADSNPDAENSNCGVTLVTLGTQPE